MTATFDAMFKVAARVLRGVGALGAVAGCASMTAMLPGLAASMFAAVGLATSTAAGRALATVAEPLFVVSAVLMVLGALACSRLAILLAAAGCVAAFVGMFVLTSVAAMARTGSMGATPPAAETLFYMGAALIVASFATTLVRRRRRSCAPVVAALAR
ncbi:hypothetical protein K6U06_19030 [Acidiferrimicrobium sp. IK]|jgi:hypothetical protein|uniref:hypothetical protein n=1 Tax=Acidiferrimicrobium sp. IK TaxID=2871700 RepID=UPI0021CB0CE5|nr:hypothetical protein [Acidiferrimicrobium sp. IK]MCU4186470.1 hypothetical protein [Acidiferrimicrobium sp. IK]